MTYYGDTLGMILFILLLIMVVIWAYHTNVRMQELELENSELRAKLRRQEVKEAIKNIFDNASKAQEL